MRNAWGPNPQMDRHMQGEATSWAAAEFKDIDLGD
ncbi:transposase [Cupriavidus taiwanensis]|uniref:Transposase n=3 Tax=Cupriavidus TaxID=106589 RepID=A0A375DVH3_9BURK|nr:transposase [Cupriavidus taiwanensis]SOZ40434.1 transposase [Cupriavidus neocaledonicus]SOY74489.1 transposase [Cupriavidus taiwanensis]SOY74496.1 transposase [Cupriavidus taiwanensis]SOY75386.1 transposase [Cupriavidus taiwanensis]